jgi:SnoaL-like polyketide cyclase
MSAGPLGAFVRGYLDRVVNRRDVTAVDDLVAADYRGTGQGWPADLDSLRQFYVRQAELRPDWRIDVQETMELGDVVAVRAFAGGSVSHDAGGSPLATPYRKDVEWLTVYRVRDNRIAEITLLSVRDRDVPPCPDGRSAPVVVTLDRPA